MSYVADDQEAAISDLIAFTGELIEIDGQKTMAHIQRGEITQDASEVGLDNRDDSITATIINKGSIPNFSASVLYRGKPYSISSISPEGERVLSLTLTND